MLKSHVATPGKRSGNEIFNIVRQNKVARQVFVHLGMISLLTPQSFYFFYWPGKCTMSPKFPKGMFTRKTEEPVSFSEYLNTFKNKIKSVL